MGKIEHFELERLGHYKWAGPGFFDHPDGEDLPGKIKFATIVASSAGLILGGFVASGIFKPAPVNLVDRLIITARCLVPCFGVTMTYTTVTYCSARLRGKNDEINHIWGGLFSGASLGVLTPFKIFGVYGAISFPLLACYGKNQYLKGDKFLPHFTYQNFSSYYSRNFDFSTTPDIQGNWTRAPKPIKEKTVVCTEI